MWVPYIQTSSFSTRQKPSLIWAFPVRIDLTSVPRSWIPASNRSPTSKSRKTLELRISVRRGASFLGAAMEGVGGEACLGPPPDYPGAARSVVAGLETDLFLDDLAQRGILGRQLFQGLDHGAVAALQLLDPARNN